MARPGFNNPLAIAIDTHNNNKTAIVRNEDAAEDVVMLTMDRQSTTKRLNSNEFRLNYILSSDIIAGLRNTHF